MNQGRIIVNITKQLVGPAFNSTWNVFVDGGFVGTADFKNNLILPISDGAHVVQLKVGLQETKVLEVLVADNDVIVECAYDGTVNNFFVVGQAQPAFEQQTDSSTISSTNAAPKKKANIWVILACIFIGLGIIGALGDEGDSESSNDSLSSSNEKADFGITLEEYIQNVQNTGVNNLEYAAEEVVEDGKGYIYTHGDRMIFIYTRSNGNVYKVIYNDSEFEHGLQQVSTIILELASKFLSSTEVRESQSTIYTAIYDCLLMDGAGGTYQFDDCTIGYSRTLVEHYESAWIEAK